MELFYESYIPLVSAGAILLFFLTAFWYVSSNVRFLYAVPIPLLVIIGGMVLDGAIETDREAVWRTFNAVRAALVAQDIPAVEKYLTPEAKATLDRVEWAIKAIEIRSIGIYDLKLEFNNFTAPPTARAAFQGVVKYKTNNEKLNFGEVYIANFIVELEKEDEDWLITHHVEHSGGL